MNLNRNCIFYIKLKKFNEIKNTSTYEIILSKNIYFNEKNVSPKKSSMLLRLVDKTQQILIL